MFERRECDLPVRAIHILFQAGFTVYFAFQTHYLKQPNFGGYMDTLHGNKSFSANENSKQSNTPESQCDIPPGVAAVGGSNAAAEALFSLLQNHWPGAKPLLYVTGNKSRAGKGTIVVSTQCPSILKREVEVNRI